MTATAGIGSLLLTGGGPAPTPAQLRAIEAPPGPVLVVAGPGAGKTFCLIGRIAYLIGTRSSRPPPHLRHHLHQQGRGRDRRAAQARGRRRSRRSRPGHPACALPRAAAGARRGDGAAPRLRTRGRGLPEAACFGGSTSGPSASAQLLRLFGRHQLEHYPLTAGDLEHFTGYREAPPGARTARLQRPDRPHRRAAREHPAIADADPGPVGRGAGGRVPGSQPGAVRRHHGARRRAPALLRGGRRRTVHLLLGRRRSQDPATVPRRFRRHGGSARPEPALLPANLRGGPPGDRAQSGAVPQGDRGGPGVRPLRRVVLVRRRGGRSLLGARRPLARPADTGLGWGEYALLYRPTSRDSTWRCAASRPGSPAGWRRVSRSGTTR